jgi:hypothetical protein
MLSYGISFYDFIYLYYLDSLLILKKVLFYLGLVYFLDYFLKVLEVKLC